MDYARKAFVVGAVGDAALQLIVWNTDYNWGLRDYFDDHKPLESIFIAAGLMYAAAWGLVRYLGRAPTVLEAAAYGGALDVAFRWLRLMPTLDGYYHWLSPPVTILWGAVPMIIPLYV